MEDTATVAASSNVVRPEFNSRAARVRGAPAERIARLAEHLGRDGRKLRAVELLLTVRNAQVLALDVPSCAKLASVASDLDRILQRVQRAGYRQMDAQLIAASRKTEDELARAVHELTEHAAILAAHAAVDPDVLLDPTVRRRLRELKASQVEADVSAAGETSSERTRGRAARA
jgi:hypothetical protein